MALRWFLHSACHVLGYQNEPNDLQYRKNMTTEQSEGVTRRSKVSSNFDLMSPQNAKMHRSSGFQMPLHYPRYTKADYEKMEEWKVDVLLGEYGLSLEGNVSLDEKRAYAMGTFLWPDQY